VYARLQPSSSQVYSCCVALLDYYLVAKMQKLDQNVHVCANALNVIALV